MKNIHAACQGSVLSEIIRDRRDWAAAHGSRKTSRLARVSSLVTLIVLWTLVALALTGRMPEPVETLFVQVIEIVRSTAVHVLRVLAQTG